MKPRMNIYAAAPDLMAEVVRLSKAVDGCGLEKSLIHLIKLRASQINGCTFCVDRHSREARDDGESEQRVYLVAVWKDSPLFSPRERAALAMVEAVTNITREGVPDTLYEATLREFSEAEIVKVTAVIGMINFWNRLSITANAIHPVARPQVA